MAVGFNMALLFLQEVHSVKRLDGDDKGLRVSLLGVHGTKSKASKEKVFTFTQRKRAEHKVCNLSMGKYKR